MTLNDVTERKQLDEFYRSNGVSDTNDKINFLTGIMKIRATIGEGAETPEEVLGGLEELALLGLWRAAY